MDWTVDGRAFSLMPMSKKVAGTRLAVRIWRIAPVLAPGPSSKVSATVLPAPGALRWTPKGAGGHAATAAARACGGGGPAAGPPASTSDGGHGPSGNGWGGGGCGGGTGAACAIGTVAVQA